MMRVLLVSEPGPSRDALVGALAAQGLGALLVAPGRSVPDELAESDAVVFVDDGPDEMSSLEQTVRRYGDLPIVVLSDAPDARHALTRHEEGWAVLPADTSPRVVAAVVVAAMAGLVTTTVSRPVDRDSVGQERWTGGLHQGSGAIEESLTPREREVLVLLADGLSNRGIAANLGISEHTVKVHVSTIYAKLGAANRAEAVARGIQRGWVAL
jgi:DNA-binding NarL/FixJ family response regulator